jgi:hypothetical protein
LLRKPLGFWCLLEKCFDSIYLHASEKENLLIQDMLEILKLLVALGIASFSFQCFHLAYRLWFGDPHAYKQNQIRTGTWKASVLGRVRPNFDGRRDYRVAAGIVYDTEEKRWVEQGRLSSEAIAATLK